MGDGLAGNCADTSAQLRSISEALTGARRVAQALPGFPGELPHGLDEAYEVQRLSRAVWPDRVAGWKVGGVPPALVVSLGQERVVGPIFSRNTVGVAAGAVAKMPVFAGGFAAIEPEFVIELGDALLPQRMFIGAEIASSPLPAINDIGPVAVVCDFGNNGGLLLGPEIADWQGIEPGDVTVETWINGTSIAVRSLDDFRADAMRAFDFMIDHANRHGIALPPGTLISTGAITGVHEADVGARSKLVFGQFGTIELELVEALPLS